MAYATIRQLAQAALTTTAQSYYTAGNNAEDSAAIIEEIIFCNTGQDTATINLYLVPPGGSPSVANALVSNLAVTGQGTVFLGEPTALPSFTTLYVQASNDDVVGMSVSGVEMSAVIATRLVITPGVPYNKP